MGVHRASHHLVRRPLQRVPLWGRLLTCGGLAIRLPPLDAPLRPSENRSALFAACRYLGPLGKLSATWRITRPALLLRRRDALARRRAQDALATGWLRRRGRGRRNGFAFQRGLNLPDLFFDPLFLNLIAHQGHL